MWIFENPKSYPEMCKKISQSLFAVILIELFVLSQISPDFSELMKIISFKTETEIINIKLYVSYIYIPIFFSIIENIFKGHDFIGKIIRVRKNYAAFVILPTYIKELCIDISVNKKHRRLYKKSKNLQNAIDNHFYYHVSYANPKIDSHDVYMALDSWGWFWIFLNTISFTILMLFSLLIAKIFNDISNSLLIGLLWFVILLIFFCFSILKRCSYYTKREIKLAVKYDKENNNNEMNTKLKGILENALLD